MKTIVLGVIAASALASCSYMAPVYLNNASSRQILVFFQDHEVHVKPGKTRKIRGLHYSGAAIQFVGGARVSFGKSLRELVDNYRKYDAYICSGFWGTRIDVRLKNEQTFELLPCDQEGKVQLFSPD
jgi:hypothetical protein